MKIVDNRKIFDTRKIQNLLDIVDPKKDTIDLGICRADLVAIAGTGTYRCNVGKHRPDTLLSQVVKTGRPLILENRNSSDQCRRCPGKSACPYKGVVYYPLKIDDVTLGAIYLMSKKVLSNNAQLYAEFLQKLSSFTMELIASDKSFFQNERYVNSIIDLIPDGLVTCSQKGLVKNVNTSALKFFNLRSHDASGAIDIRSLLPNIRLDTEDSTYRYNDRFKIKVRHIEDTGYILRISPDLILDLKKLDYIVGSSDAIKAAKERACVIAKYDSPTLILGETGSGKELFAQAIHNQSSRGTKDLVTIDCSSIPGNLLESELFGYVEGAFTGAKASGKKGKLELSNNGSIFLDEIGEIPLHLQSKLLRVIENNTFDRLGDTKTTYVNTRIIAATNRDLWQMVQERKFRNDLYYRLNVMQLQVPPLRARKGDIRALTDYFLDFYNRKFNKNIKIDDEVLVIFEKYDWPGNVRELKNLLEYCIAFVKDDIVLPETFPGWFKNNIVYSDKPAAEKKHMLSMEAAEKSYIEKSLLLYGNSTRGKREAAKSLGISLATFYRKLKKYNLE